MATAMMTKSCIVAKAAVVAKSPNTARLARLGQADVSAEWTRKTVSNGSRVNQMMVWHPQDNKYFETLSFLPPLTDDQIAKQVDYITNNGWTPCLEFANADQAYVASTNTGRMGPVSSGYEDNRYWTMFKLPMFGCTDSSQVLSEVANCAKLFPDAYIRLVAFDAVRQVQVTGFLVHRPPGATDFRAPKERSI